MIKQYQRFFNLILILIDVAVITFSLFLAWYIRFETNLLGFGKSEWGLYHYMVPLILIIPLYILLYYNFPLCDPQRTSRDIGSEAFQIIKVNLVGVLVLVAVLFLLELTDYSRFLLAMFAIFSTTFSIVERYLLRRSLQYFRSKDFNIKYILVIGAGELAEKFTEKMEKNTYLGYRIIGFPAPWSNTLKTTSIVFTGVMILVMVLAGPVGVAIGVTILLLGGFMIVRGYSIREGQIIVHGLVWNKGYPIATLCDLESSPFITAGSIRTFGIGGLFSFWGYFKNPTLGNYLSFITDPANTVVLYYDNIRIVISPDDPEGFIEEARREYKRTRIT